VSSFDGETWTTVSDEQGLTDGWVQAVIVAPDGALWFGTGFGAARYLPPR
jgi:ligand-binding sensor domain-containing protein